MSDTGNEKPKTISSGKAFFILISSMLLIGFIVVKIIDGPAPQRSKAPPPAAAKPASKPWHNGGTLHQKTAADWIAASSANRLATAADFVATQKDRFGIKTIDELRGPAVQLVTCIDESAKGDLGQQVSGLAAACIMLLASR